MSYIIHGARGSGSSLVEAACAFVGAEYELRDLDMRAQEQRGAAYAALNPQRKIPTLEADDGEIISESVAIVLTLDERHPEAGLLPPPGSQPRAQALRWMLRLATELYPIIEIVDYPERFAPSPGATEAMRERAKAIWHERWLVVEASLPSAPHCVERGFCAADLYVAVLSRWDLDEAWRREHLPKVEAITAAVRRRPELAAVWSRHFG